MAPFLFAEQSQRKLTSDLHNNAATIAAHQLTGHSPII